MPFIGEIASPSPTLDHQMTTFDAIMKLINLGKEYAFVKKDEKYIGIVSLANILEDHSDAPVTDFMEPLCIIRADEHKHKATTLMLQNNVEHIAVTSEAGEFLGITSAKKVQDES
ncbi:MAG: CBS domain-containing protein [Nitrospinae bacterium]|nr:CBS domain-containing protein [Nitrospinota bacterium]MZH40437.1 CBS domain-containing protein [Nitrospinota bacterium]